MLSFKCLVHCRMNQTKDRKLASDNCVLLTLYGSARNEANDGRSQTQPETQPITNIDTRPKRKSREEQNGRAKRVKISVGDAMDLGD